MPTPNNHRAKLHVLRADPRSPTGTSIQQLTPVEIRVAKAMARQLLSLVPSDIALRIGTCLSAAGYRRPVVKLNTRHSCCRCGTTKNVVFGPDPFQSELYDDDTSVWECSSCRAEAAGDV